MQKQDLVVFIAAILIVLILAFVIKPIMNGEPVLPEQGSGTISLPSKIPVPEGSSDNPYTPSVIMETTATPTPSWDGTAYNVQFVDPSTYNIEWEGSLKDFGYAIPAYAEPESNEMVLYATINGQWDATTQIISIPFPLWEIDARIEGIGDVGFSNEDEDSDDEGDGVEGLVASEGESLGAEVSKMHFIMPWVNIQVMNADNPEGPIYILNTLTEGPVPIEIDKAEGSATKDYFPGQDDEDNTDEDDDEIDTLTRENVDEYKWVHKFYEGSGNYYFIINPNMLKSYTIDIYVPKKFLES
ncbi:hypothetical protein [Methanolacinia paynteri]|uniref:hypothetical protein n=1 Tax=Methanolacinia paynteri TaxID=230356 RepID=UPI00064ECC31|nr:hypothetical protein [Methanolacinia paynteri]